MKSRFLEPQINTKGLIAHYKLQDGFTSSGKVFDYSLNGNLGIVNGTSCLPTYPGFYFDGSADYISVADSVSLDVTAVTISAYVKLDSNFAALGYIAVKMEDWAATGEVSYGFRVDAGRTIGLFISNSGSNEAGILVAETSTGTLTKSIWYHVVGTYDGAGTYAIYIDGALDSSDGNGNETDTIYVGTGRMILGARWDLSASAAAVRFKGTLDNVMIFNRVLSAEEVRSIYETTRYRYAV